MARAARHAALALALATAAGCGDFESPSIVLDLRVLGMSAGPPEVIVPPDASEVSLADLPTIEVCALVADPRRGRELTYDFTACPPTEHLRCDDPEAPKIALAAGAVADPESAADPVRVCGSLAPSARLLAVLEASVDAAELAGLGGLPVQVTLEVDPGDGAEDGRDTVFAAKRVYYAPELPAGRVANENPELSRITAARTPTGRRDEDFELPLGRCADIDPPVVAPGEALMLLPVEPDGAREDYVLPTLDGDSRAFTENLGYAWYATHGDWSRESSGGPRDAAGNHPPLDSTWTAPEDPAVVGDGLSVPLWVVQRDERGGQAWYQSCARVRP